MNNYEKLVENNASELIERLLNHIIGQEHFEILFNFLEQDQWAIVSMHDYDEDLEVSIRLHLNDVYDLYLGYYDDEDEFHEIVHPFTEEEKQILPDTLIKLMKKVVEDEQGIRIAGKLIKGRK